MVSEETKARAAQSAKASKATKAVRMAKAAQALRLQAAQHSVASMQHALAAEMTLYAEMRRVQQVSKGKNG